MPTLDVARLAPKSLTAALALSVSLTGSAVASDAPKDKPEGKDKSQKELDKYIESLPPQFKEVTGAELPTVGGGSSGGGMSTMVFRRAFNVPNALWANLRGAPGSFSVGLARHGWGLDVSQQYISPTGGYWYFGHIAGSANGCLWTETSQTVSAGTPQFDCGAVGAGSLPESSYMQYFNGNGQGNCTPEGQCDGTAVAVTGDCAVYSNVQPWAPNAGAVGEHMYTIPNGQTFKWRYLTKDGRFVMGRYENWRPRLNAGANAGGQDWGFAKASCVPRKGTQAPPRN